MQNRTVYHGRDLKAVMRGDHTPKFTIGFQYDSESNMLYIAWSKPHTGESFIRKMGYQAVNTRLDRMVNKGASYGKNIPKMVHENINNYITLVRKYFKEMPEKVNIII
jgi:hypothetical protein